MLWGKWKCCLHLRENEKLESLRCLYGLSDTNVRHVICHSTLDAKVIIVTVNTPDLSLEAVWMFFVCLFVCFLSMSFFLCVLSSNGIVQHFGKYAYLFLLARVKWGDHLSSKYEAGACSRLTSVQMYLNIGAIQQTSPRLHQLWAEQHGCVVNRGRCTHFWELPGRWLWPFQSPALCFPPTSDLCAKLS